MTKSAALNLLGLTIVGQHGREVGTISEVLVDVTTWNVEEVEVKLNRETLDDLKLKRPWFGTQQVCIPTDQVSGASDMLVLKAPLEEMEFAGGEQVTNEAVEKLPDSDAK